MKKTKAKGRQGEVWAGGARMVVPGVGFSGDHSGEELFKWRLEE